MNTNQTKEEIMAQIATLKAQLKTPKSADFLSETCKTASSYHQSFNAEFKSIATQMIAKDQELAKEVITKDKDRILVTSKFKDLFYNRVRQAMIEKYGLQ